MTILETYDEMKEYIKNLPRPKRILLLCHKSQIAEVRKKFKDYFKELDFLTLLENGNNILITIEEFLMFKSSDLKKLRNYTLIALCDMNWVCLPLTVYDAKNLTEKFVNTDGGRITWRENMNSYEGYFTDYKNLCLFSIECFIGPGTLYGKIKKEEIYKLFKDVVIVNLRDV